MVHGFARGPGPRGRSESPCRPGRWTVGPGAVFRRIAACDQLLARAGSETKVITDKMTKRKGNPQYWRESDYENGPEPIVLRFVFNAQAQVIGIGMGPLSQTPAPDAP